MTDEQQYKEGFNASFLLAEHEPSLLERISKNVNPTSDFLEGLIDGRLQYALEKTKDELVVLKGLRNAAKERDNEKELY